MILFVSLYSKAFYFHKVEKYLVIFVTSLKWKLIQKETRNFGKLFSIKVEIIVMFSFPENRKCYTSKFYFHKMERYLNFQKVEKTKLFSMFIYILCGLLRLNPGAWGEHLTSQLSWATAWLLVTCANSVYLVVDEFSPCVLRSLMIGLMVLVLIFVHMVSMILLIGS